MHKKWYVELRFKSVPNSFVRINVNTRREANDILMGIVEDRGNNVETNWFWDRDGTVIFVDLTDVRTGFVSYR